MNQRQVVGQFDGGAITTDAGGLLLREVEKWTGIIARLAGCFRDYRAAEQIEHTVKERVAQRVYGMVLGYEDLNDHDELRRDPLLAVLAEKPDATGESRVRDRDRGKALAGKSTLNRLELTKAEVTAGERYKKIALDLEAVDRLLVAVFLEAHAVPAAEIVLDLEATDDPLHGNQEGRFFHAYYGHYCYLPLYIFSGDHLLCARLRSSNLDAWAGCVDEVERIVRQIRQAWPAVKITLRGDSGFRREELMAWCEQNQVDYVLGLAKNDRLRAEIVAEQEQAAAGHRQGRASGERRQSALRRDLARGGNLGCSPLVRRALLRTGRDGESHQGTAHAVRRPHLDGMVAQQSDSALLFLHGLHARGGAAAAGFESDGVGRSPGRDDSMEAAEDRRAHPPHCA